MKQTAVEWFVEKLNQCEPMYSGIQSKEHKEYIDMLIEQAKEMEKEQIKQAYNDGKAAVIHIENNMSLDEYLSESGEEFAKKEINDEISKLTSFNKVYVYPDEDMIFITNSLDRFSDGYKTEEDWGLGEDREWVEI